MKFLTSTKLVILLSRIGFTGLLFFSFQETLAQQEIWGATVGGGTDNLGVVFKANADGTGLTVLHEFLFSSYRGQFPNGALIQASNGKLYGLTNRGGANNLGSLFEYDPVTFVFANKVDFAGSSNGTSPWAALTQANNGKLYGTTLRGGVNNDSGTLFEFDPATSVFTKKVDFGGTNGQGPFGMTLLLASNGKLYGTTTIGGVGNNGVIFEYDPATSIYAKKIDFPTTIGRGPRTSLLEYNGKLYGTAAGGANNSGVVYEFDPVAVTCVKVLDFPANGSNSNISMAKSTNGKFYGVGSNATNASGLIYEFNPATYTYTKKFDMTETGLPTGPLAEGPDGKLYGMISSGGTAGYGWIFSFDPSTLSVIKKKDFTSDPDAASPNFNSLMLASNGIMFGMTYQGGLNGGGTLFELDPASSVFTKRVDFAGSPDGSAPSGLTQAFNGRWYFTTNNSLYELDAAGTSLSKKVQFTNSSQVVGPTGSLTQAMNGKLYGMYAGTSNVGVIFEYDPLTSILINRADFSESTGKVPQGPLLNASNGKLYGMTTYGGTNNFGIFFEYDPFLNVITKKFDLASVGSFNPSGNDLVQSANGKIYGMTFGGTNNFGVIFEFDPVTSAFAKTFDFTDHTSGNVFTGGLTQSSNGKLYGITANGGSNSYGALFEFDITMPSPTYLKKVDFSNSNGVFPGATLIQSKNGKLYGTTNFLGSGGYGNLFEFDPSTSTYAIKTSFNKSNGGSPGSTNVLTFSRDVQSITFGTLATKNFGDAPFQISASASSGLAIQFRSSDPTVATVTGNMVTILGGGTTTITAYQPGDVTYNVALPVSQSLTVNKINQTISFSTIPAMTLGDPAFGLTATASSSLPVTFTTASDKVTVSGNTVTLVKAGSVTISASQPGNTTFSAAPSVSQVFCINPAKPTISAGGSGAESIALTSSSISGNQWFLNGTAVAGATGNIYNAKTPGNYTVNVTVDNCASQPSVAQAVITTGDLKETRINELLLFPNPAKSKLNIQLNGFQPQVVEVIIYDNSGKFIEQLTATGNGSATLDISRYSSGKYIIVATQQEKRQRKHFIKE